MNLFSNEVPKNFVELPDDLRANDMACEDVSMAMSESPCLAVGDFHPMFSTPKNNIGQILPPFINQHIEKLSQNFKTNLPNAGPGFVQTTIRKEPAQRSP